MKHNNYDPSKYKLQITVILPLHANQRYDKVNHFSDIQLSDTPMT